MSLLQATLTHGAPYWSPYAIGVGLVIGMLIGAILVGLFALRLARRNQVRDLLQPDPAGYTIGGWSRTQLPHGAAREVRHG